MVERVGHNREKNEEHDKDCLNEKFYLTRGGNIYIYFKSHLFSIIANKFF